MPFTPFRVADMVVVPAPEAVASPQLVTIAAPGFEELQPALIRTCVVPSVKVPLAENATEPPFALIVALEGNTTMEESVALVVVTLVVPVTVPKLAVTFVIPGTSAVRIPECTPMLATDWLLVPQFAE